MSFKLPLCTGGLVLKLTRSMLVLAAALLANSAFADALCSHGVGAFAGGTSSMSPTSNSFERNRAAFNARGLNGKRVKFCVVVDGELKKINQPRLRKYRRAPLEELVGALVDCENPTTLALTQVKPKKRPQVLAYLFTKYRLNPTSRALEEQLARRQKVAALDAAVASTSR